MSNYIMFRASLCFDLEDYARLLRNIASLDALGKLKGNVKRIIYRNNFNMSVYYIVREDDFNDHIRKLLSYDVDAQGYYKVVGENMQLFECFGEGDGMFHIGRLREVDDMRHIDECFYNEEQEVIYAVEPHLSNYYEAGDTIIDKNGSIGTVLEVKGNVLHVEFGRAITDAERKQAYNVGSN